MKCFDHFVRLVVNADTYVRPFARLCPSVCCLLGFTYYLGFVRLSYCIYIFIYLFLFFFAPFFLSFFFFLLYFFHFFLFSFFLSFCLSFFLSFFYLNHFCFRSNRRHCGSLDRRTQLRPPKPPHSHFWRLCYFRYGVYIKYCVFYKNSSKFATSPSLALVCYSVQKRPANRRGTVHCTLALR